MKTLKDLVESGLRAGGFGGLCNDFAGCACWVDDLFPCGEPSGECMAGYTGPCNGSCDDPPCEGHVFEVEICEMCGDAVDNGETHGEGRCFDSDGSGRWCAEDEPK